MGTTTSSTAIVTALNAASQDVVSVAMPVVAGTPRYVAGGSNLGHADVVVAPTPAALRSPTDAPKPAADARESNRQRVNNDRSAYQQQGLRPAGGEPWRRHAGGVDESFF